ncbi:MAG: D-2-hydroxyacid dehydrogenase [Gemmatimonadales bacterium]
MPESQQRSPILMLVLVALGAAGGFLLGRRGSPATEAPPPAAAAPAADSTPLGLTESGERLDAAQGWKAPTKVAVWDFWPGRTAELAQVAPGVEVVVANSASALAAAAVDADAVMGPLSPEVWQEATRLRWVQLPYAGVERPLAIPGVRESDVMLSNAQRIYAEGLAEHAMAMVLGLARRLPTALALQREHRWDSEPLIGAGPSGQGGPFVELNGRTLLVAGLGGIGTEIARLAHGMGMRVVATRGSSRAGPDFVEYVGLADELPKLAAEADVIVNVVPLTKATERIFDGAFFDQAKRGALFVNVGRGRSVDTDALVAALRDGRIGGAALDVTDPEPLPAASPLWSMPNVIITPHVAGGESDGDLKRLWVLFEENLRRFATGGRLLSVVDKARGY